VLLTGPVSRSDDARFRDLAFEMTERLKRERIILITKAVSWLLRSDEARYRPKDALKPLVASPQSRPVPSSSSAQPCAPPGATCTARAVGRERHAIACAVLARHPCSMRRCVSHP
jgi:hypothetical protein